MGAVQGTEAVGDEQDSAGGVCCEQVCHQLVSGGGVQVLTRLVQEHEGGRSRQGAR